MQTGGVGSDLQRLLPNINPLNGIKNYNVVVVSIIYNYNLISFLLHKIIF